MVWYSQNGSGAATFRCYCHCTASCYYHHWSHNNSDAVVKTMQRALYVVLRGIAERQCNVLSRNVTTSVRSSGGWWQTVSRPRSGYMSDWEKHALFTPPVHYLLPGWIKMCLISQFICTNRQISRRQSVSNRLRLDSRWPAKTEFTPTLRMRMSRSLIDWWNKTKSNENSVVATAAKPTACHTNPQSHARMVVRECCKGDDETQWERGKFDSRHPKTP